MQIVGALPGLVDRQAIRPHEALINDHGVVAARVDALVGGGLRRVVVHQPHARAIGMDAVRTGAQRQVDALGRRDREGVAGDLRRLRDRIAVEIGQGRVMAVGVERERAAADIEDAQLGGLVRFHQDGRVADREGIAAAVEQEDVRLALRRVVVAVHAPLDLARVAVGRRNAVEPVVDVHINERILALNLLGRRLGHRLDAPRSRDQMREMIVGPVGLDDDHAGEAHQRMDVVLHVAVIPVGARRLRHEAVGELPPRRDRALGHVRHAVHGVVLRHPVEMDGVRQVMRVVQRHIDDVALLDPDGRARQPRRRAHRAAERREHPEGDVLARIDFFLDFDDLEVDVDLVGVAVAVEIVAELDRVGVGARDRRHLGIHAGALRRAARQIGRRQPVGAGIGRDRALVGLMGGGDRNKRREQEQRQNDRRTPHGEERA